MSSKIQGLLKKAEQQSKSASTEKSSIACATRDFSSGAEAEASFQRLKEKLFRIERWNAESGLSSFELFDAEGVPRKNETAALGDFIKITLPGSGKPDWVKVFDIYEAPDEVVLTVKPSPDPTDKEADEKRTSHFFTSDAINNFCLARKDSALNFYVIGLSEITNTEDTENVLETVRNFATAHLGHYFGIQKGEWTTFSENFLEIKEK
jgi:hypothetical protein